MTDHISLLVTAGDGLAECIQAVGHILERMKREAAEYRLVLSVHRSEGRHGPKSAVVTASGSRAKAFGQAWCGTIQWRMQSHLRRNHKRSNWFVGVFELDRPDQSVAPIREGDVAFSTLRAGGPGGQHQNTTDSAVRATHRPSGLTVVVREARSQHRNKALALERLQSAADARALADQEQRKFARNQLHHELERGNPLRCFKGGGFKEITR